MWQQRRQRLGDGAVGRKGEDYRAQGNRIAEQLRTHLDQHHFEHGLDYGCGWGRLSGLIDQYCGHLWVADIFSDWTARAATKPTMTPLTLDSHVLPLEAKSVNLIVDIMTLQSVGELLLAACANELQRVAVPGARIIVLQHQVPGREPKVLANLLHLSDGWKAHETVTIDQSGDAYYFLVGRRAGE
jgi:ubiquinone/menaquinone biosynthesis C-methylase UbiE